MSKISPKANYFTHSPLSSAVWTGLEPATPCVTGRYSNQLNYHTRISFSTFANPPFSDKTSLCLICECKVILYF